MNPIFHLRGDYHAHSKIKWGFTLVELLVVIAIIGILTAVTLPSIVSILQGSQLAQGEEMIENNLSYARQLALSKNETVTVRLYQFADPTFPGEIAGTASSGKFRAVQIFETTSSGALNPMSKPSRIPASIIMDKGSGSASTTLSSLLDASNSQTITSAIGTDPSIFSVGNSYNYVSLQFKPDGSTNLNSSSNWFVTLHSITATDGSPTPPSNYYTIQIDPSYGHISTFRP